MSSLTRNISTTRAGFTTSGRRDYESPPSIALIIPSSRLTEPQFNAYVPPQVGIHVTRLRMTGKFCKPLSELKRSLAEAAEAISDLKPGGIVFHRTTNSMENGLAHEAAIVEIIEKASGCPTITTRQAITQAFNHFGIKKLVPVSPYIKETNEREVKYLSEAGFTVLHELGLALDPYAYSSVTPEEWEKVVKENACAQADGYFLSCTATRMIEAIDDLERDLGKPVISSNQAFAKKVISRLVK